MRPLRMPRAAMASAPDLAPAGLRERKKAHTRQLISDVATRLFLERGFDEVTVAEIAAVADVSVKTVFNYFGSKEDLLFDRQDEVIRSVEAVAAARAPGVPLVDALLASIQERYPAAPWGAWADLTPATVEGRRAFARMVDGHPQLRTHVLAIERRVAESVRRIVATDLERPADDPQVLAYAHLIHAAYSATGVEMNRSLLAGCSADEIRERSVAAGGAALAVLQTALANARLATPPAPAEPAPL